MARIYDTRRRRFVEKYVPPRTDGRRFIDTEEGVLSFSVNPWYWQPEGWQRMATLNGASISDDELEFRLAALA